MTRQALFIQGAGEGAYSEDKKLADSLRQALGPAYDVRYPVMPDVGDAPYESWKQQIETELATLTGPVILVGHSVGASILLKCLTEMDIGLLVAGIFLISTPFWGGDGWQYDGYQKLELPKDVAVRLPQDTQVFLYHSQDDEIVPFSHLALYAHMLPKATVRDIDGGGHQLNNDLTMVAKDIISVAQKPSKA